MNGNQDSRTAAHDVPAKVAAVLADLDEQFMQIVRAPARGAVELAARAERLALVCARRAGWWGVLLAGTRGAGVPGPFRVAVLYAWTGEQDRARFWRDSARDWRARAGGEPRGVDAWARWDRDEQHDDAPVRSGEGGGERAGVAR